ncbi:hypothetical protein A3725_32635 [Alcanivorax sp. HI0035]|nr:hypothetical protein A3725_32635 [Alcanivorax sp. HI0035]
MAIAPPPFPFYPDKPGLRQFTHMVGYRRGTNIETLHEVPEGTTRRHFRQIRMTMGPAMLQNHLVDSQAVRIGQGPKGRCQLLRRALRYVFPCQNRHLPTKQFDGYKTNL